MSQTPQVNVRREARGTSGGTRWALGALFASLAIVVAACGSGGGTAKPSGSAPVSSGSPAATQSAAASTAAASPSSAAPSESTAASPSESAGASPSESAGASPTESAGASPSESAGASPSASTGTGGALEPPANPVTLDFWNPWTGADGDTAKALTDEFNAATPNVKITFATQPEYYTKLSNAIKGGTPPDVMIMHIDQLALYAAQDQLEPVDDFISQTGLSEADFTPAVWAGTKWKDHQYSVPLDIHPATLYYNKAAFTKANLDPAKPPTDKASFEDALTKLKAAGYTGPTWSNHFYSASLFWASLFYQGGGEWTNADYTAATFNSQAGVQAAEYMRSLIDQGLQPQDVEADAEVSSFEAGTSGMAITGIWQTTRFQKSLGADFGAAPIPQIFGKGVWAGSHTFAIRKGLEGDELKGAYYFIDWFTNNSVKWAAGGQLPAKASVRADPAFAALKDIPDIAKQVDDARFPPPIPQSADFLGGPQGVTEKLLEVLAGQGDAKGKLDAAAAYYTDILKANKAKYNF